MTTEFYVYDAITGDILRTGGCSAGHVDIQAQPGEVAIAGTADQATQKHDIASGTLVPRAKTADEYVGDAMRQRYTLITASDWTQLPDVPLATKAAWATYRQSLRDITLQPGYPQSVVWPTPPA